MKTRGSRRHVEGVVTSDRMNKSVVVEVKRLVKHPFYGKFIRRRMKLMAHDEDNVAHTGDRVELVETRPRSKSKKWRVLRVLQASHVVAPIELEEDVAKVISPREHEHPHRPAKADAATETPETPEDAEAPGEPDEAQDTNEDA